jgi:hypothetical protein
MRVYTAVVILFIFHVEKRVGVRTGEEGEMCRVFNAKLPILFQPVLLLVRQLLIICIKYINVASVSINIFGLLFR